MTTDDMSAIITMVSMATPLNVFGFATFVVKACMLIALTAGVVALCLRLLRRQPGAKASTRWGWLGFGLFGAAYSALNSYMGFRYFPIDRVHEITPVELVPHIAVVAYCLALAGLAWVISRYGAGKRA